MNSLTAVAVLTSTSIFMSSLRAEFEARDLQVDEGFVNPMGFHDATPVFSWKLPPGVTRQTTYQIVVTDESGKSILLDSGKTASDQSTWVSFTGKPLESRQCVTWKVKVWNDAGIESDWSKPAGIEMGLLSNKDWKAEWIESPALGTAFDWAKVKLLKAEYGRAGKMKNVLPLLARAIEKNRVPMPIDNKSMGEEDSLETQNHLRVEYQYEGEKLVREFKENQSFDLDENSISAHPGYCFRHEFPVDGQVVKARLYASALGIYEFQINGKRVGNDLMAPGWTAYQKRVETLTYDVTSMLHEGKNTIGAILGEGWYAGSLFMRSIASLKGEKPKLLGQLELTYAGGRTVVVATDSTWKVTDKGPILASGYYFGEDYDARRELGNWAESGYDSSAWTPVKATPIAATPLLEPKRMPPVRIMQDVAAVSVKELNNGVFLFDFGQNLVGFPEMTIPVKKDTTVTVRVAEMLDKEGMAYTDNYRAARARANYVAAADGTVTWAPKLTFFGFRYIELSGLPPGAHLEKNAVVAKVIHTDFQSTGKFTSSHAKLNQLQSNIRWGQIGNFVDLPTDCPQRDERLGWTGDAQVFLPTSFFNYGVYSFWARWLQTVRDEQNPDGLVPHVVPTIALGESSSPGWGDVIVTAPWEIYVRTGDIRILQDNFDAMKKWVTRYERDAKGFINEMKGFGDWLQPYAKDQRGDTPHPVIATAYFGRDARILSWAAEALGNKDEADRFRQLHANIKAAFSKKFIGADGKLTVPETQTAYLMALGYDLVDDSIRPKVEKQLMASFETADRHLRTGFLGTPLLAPTFEAAGHPEISYELLFKESYPSWFYSIDQGATTMWERWNSYSHADGFDKGGMNSFNHYAYGAIGQWMYERVAGLTPDPDSPGYKHFFIRPLIGGPLEWASAELETPYGLAKSAWKKSGKSLVMDAIVPPNTTATVLLPTKNSSSIQLNGKALTTSHLVTTYEQNLVTVGVGAGAYHFELESLQ